MIFRAALLLSVSLFAAAAWAQQEGVLHTVESNTFRPAHQPLTEDLLARLQVPDGFEVSVFARDLGNARMMAISDDGTVYVSRPNEKDVIALTEDDPEPRVVASDLDGIHGIAIREDRKSVV